MSGFYKQRVNCEYYKLAREWLESYGPRESIIDVGSADTPVASWGNFQRRYVIDPRLKPSSSEVVIVNGRWPDDACQLPKRVSVITCLQVLEHIEDVQPFVDAIFETATHRVILSVPYMWREGRTQSHVHDPVNRRKLRGWTKRRPLRTKIVGGPKSPRLVEEYSPGRQSRSR